MTRTANGWATSNRRDRLPRDWKRIRERVLVRDRYMCQWPLPGAGRCGAPAREVDHRVDPDAHGDDQLWCLCRFHHNEKTQAEALAGRVFQRRTAETHPGLID